MALVADARCCAANRILPHPRSRIITPGRHRKPVEGRFYKPFFRLLGRVSYSLYLIHFTVLAALSTWLVLRLEPGLGYLPAIAITFAVTMPVVLAASYVYARVIDEPSTFLADRLAIRSMAFVAAVRAPRLWQSRSNEL